MEMFRRVWDWWTQEPVTDWDTLPEKTWAYPVPDSAVAQEMAAAARRCHVLDERLDLTVASLEVVDELVAAGGLTAVEIHLLGAYLGEVLRRAVPTFEWCLTPRRPVAPCLAIGRHCSDPFELIESVASGSAHPEVTVADSARELIVFASDPTGETAAALGWSEEYHHAPTAWEGLEARWSAYRRKRTRREARKNNGQ